MRVNRAQATENRQNVINTASHLFREHGFDGIGLKDLMKGAGLTQGAFYKQFASKEDLAAQASKRAIESTVHRWTHAAEANPQDPLGAMMRFYLSMGHRSDRGHGCAVAALGADAARQSAQVRASFEAGIRQYLEMLGRWVGEPDHANIACKSMGTLSTMVGAVMLSRAVNDPKLARAILDSAADQIRAAVPLKRSRSRRKKTQIPRR
jgi:TetR/AcrR family transcriptional repressor of nem operon